MKHYRDTELHEALKAVDPARREELNEWALSEDGRRVYDRITESRDQVVQSSPAGTPHVRKRLIRPACIATGALVVAVAVIIAVAVGTRGSSSAVVETTVTSAAASATSGTIMREEAADALGALAAIVDMAEAIQGSAVTESPAPPATDSEGYAGRAESLGIILLAEREKVLASETVSRGTYALWVWRAFAHRLTPERQVEFQDLAPLTQEMREAVIGVAATGILDGRSDSLFEADKPLTPAEEREAGERLEKALGLRPK
jgi:hypothetical protein